MDLVEIQWGGFHMQLELLADFSIPALVLPERSKLVSLKPIGVGTPRCEALISYLTRLAGKHVVRPNALVRSVVLPLTNVCLDTSECSFSHSYSRTINSYVRYAAVFSGALEQLTLQKNLTHLTFTPWKDILDPKGSALLRDHVAFCPQCLDEQESTDEGIYYPLIWYLRAATICTRHNIRLEEKCPACGKHQLFVAHHALLGYCTHCGAWLGKSSARNIPPEVPLFSPKEKFMALALEEMIASGPTLSKVATQTHFVDCVEKYCNAVTNGNMNCFEKRLGFKKNVICNWVYKNSKPRIDLFLELCFRLQASPLEFLNGHIPKEISSQIGDLIPALVSKRVQRSEAEMLNLKNALIASLDSDAAPTQKAMAEQLGVNRRVLNHHFPELARAISDKHKRNSANRTAAKREVQILKAKEIIRNMLAATQAISRRKMWAELEKNGLTFADPAIRRAIQEVMVEFHRKPGS